MRLALLIAMTALVMPTAAFALTNGDMETVATHSTGFCADWLITGCDDGSKDVYKPSAWNTFFPDNDFGQSSSFSHGGTWSVAIWYMPPSDCFWNSTHCTNSTLGQDGSLIQHDLLLNSSLTATFWAKKCGFRPVKCDNILCDGTQYYGSNSTNQGRFLFKILDVNTSADIGAWPFSATDSWQQYSIDVTGIDSTHMNDVYWQTLTVDPTSGSPNCVLFDDLVLSPIATVPSPALDYITDMTTFINFPYTAVEEVTGATVNHGNFTFKTSRKFDTVPQLRVSLSLYGLMGDTIAESPNLMQSLVINQDDGHVNWAAMDFYVITRSEALGVWDITVTFPGLNASKITNFTLRLGEASHQYWYNLTLTPSSALTLRADPAYSDNIISGWETVTGDTGPGLYPAIVYDNDILSNLTHTFKVRDFAVNITGTSNILFYRYDADGLLVDVGSADYSSTGPGDTKFSENWLSGFDAGDTIRVVFRTSNDIYSGVMRANFTTRTEFSPEGIADCVSGCIGTSYWTRTESGTGCVAAESPNDARCGYTATPPGIGGVDYTAPVYDVTATTYPWAASLLTPLLWFAVGTVVTGAYIAWRTASPHMGMTAMLVLAVVFTLFGVFPFWVGLLIAMGIALFLVNMFRTQIFGGGGGGG